VWEIEGANPDHTKSGGISTGKVVYDDGETVSRENRTLCISQGKK